MLPDIEGAPAATWKSLAAGHGAWRTPVLASVAADGGANARTVVLRAVAVDERELVFFTDRRSAKHAELCRNPAACLVVYDAAARLQVRLYGSAQAENRAAELDAWWEALDEHQRVLYAQGARGQDLPQRDRGCGNFAAFRVRIDRFHCLWLAEDGNAAAVFEWRDGQWQGVEVRP